MKKLLSNVIANLQQTLMKHYGHFTEDDYVIERDIPTPVASLIRKLGNWLVALS